MDDLTLLRVAYTTKDGVVVTVSFTLLVLLALAVVVLLIALSWRRPWAKKYDVVEVEVALGNVGHVKLRPNTKDAQIAHQIWTELVTRKAAIPVDPDRDVIAEVYDSWYQLFQRIRALVADIPAELLRRDQSTRELVRLATQTLNEGLRPHLTRWQAEFRNWMRQHERQPGA